MFDGLTLEQLRAILEARKLAQTAGARALTPHEAQVMNRQVRILGIESDVLPPESPIIEPAGPFPTLSTSAVFDELVSRQKALYGEDDRVEVVDCTDPARCDRARSVAAIVERRNLIAAGDGRVSIGGITLEQRWALSNKPLCQREKFRAQPCAAVGTAFLVARNIIATAHHCLNEDTFAAHCLVFDFETDENGVARTDFRVDQVYGLNRYRDGAFSHDGADWALIELDRAVEDRPSLALSGGTSAVQALPLYVVGHPSGLPKKIAGNAQIRINTASSHFVANLDTYGGNSGSPVFNALTHEVEGILVRGDTDFVPLGDCYASLICPITGCQGEDCTRIGPVVESLTRQPS